MNDVMKRGVRMKRNLEGFTALLAGIAVLLASVSVCQAESPWRWQLSLTGLPSGKVMSMPSALYVDQERERYYVVDAGNNRLLSYDREGGFLNSFDAGGQLQAPYDMTRDAKGKLWVVEKGKNSLTSIDLEAKEVVPHILKHQGKLVYPDRIEFLDNVLLVLDKGSGEILILESGGLAVQQRMSCKDGGTGFVDFKVVGGVILALEPSQRAIYRFTPAGVLQGVTHLETGAEFPVSFAVGPAGRLYILDRHAGTVAVHDDQGKFKYRFLSHGQVRGRLYYPTELQFDPWGNFCVVEEGNGRVQLFRRQ